MEKEEWINHVMRSLEGSSSAQPDGALFDKIVQQVSNTEAKIIPLSRLRLVAAAAVVLLFVNVSVVNRYIQGDIADNTELAADDSSYSILSDYKIYEK